jgi:transcriptional regulator with XRE-family HTH domain
LTQNPPKPTSSPRTDTGLLVLLLRSLHGWSQAELASAMGVDLKTIQRYETGESSPSAERMGKLCAAVGLPLPLAQQGLLPMLRLSLEVSGEGHRPPADSLYEDAEAIGQEIGDRLGALAKTRLLVLLANAEQAWDEREQRYPPRPEHREAARRAWRSLETRTSEERALLIEAAEELWNWALTELLCVESGRRSSGPGTGPPADEAEELAALALGVAERACGDEAWKARLQGYATAFVANALSANGDLDGADRTLARAWALWNAGGAAPCPLEGWRLLEIEANLRRAQGRFEEALTLQERALSAKAQRMEGEGFEPSAPAAGKDSPVN